MNITAKASISAYDKAMWLVETTWLMAGLKLPGVGIVAPTRKLAERLAAAINAGKVWIDPQVKNNIYGEPYISALGQVRGRCLHADLKALGF